MKKLLAILLCIVGFQVPAQAGVFIGMMDRGAFESMISCFSLEDKGEQKQCLFEDTGDEIENQSACSRNRWNDRISISGPMSPNEKASYDYIKTSAKISMRACRGLSLIYNVEDFLADHAIAEYQYCNPENQEALEILKMIDEAEKSMKDVSGYQDVASDFVSVFKNFNSFAAKIDEKVCGKIKDEEITLPKAK